MSDTHDEPVSVPKSEPITDERAGNHLGNYLLCEVIGEGGFGTVWRAEQTEPVRREVAIKVLKRGMDTRKVLGRFKQERQALATLEHPGIATLLDAGVTADGRPWFAMELVRGAPITRWCAEEKLPLEDRLRLFQQVCMAVHHAHQKGIIHRDLKPSNVLVMRVDSRPVAKVIDFGIAKWLQTDGEASLMTIAGQRLGTPCCMSPEQVEDSAAIDTRSDVYALGVLLYELLTGELPIDRTTVGSDELDEIKRAIREQTPERPSKRTRNRASAESQTTVPAISSDLDWITLRALEKEPARRYQTTVEFADDVRRHLANEPVRACPPGFSHGVSRWLKRRKRVLTASLLGAFGTAAVIVLARQMVQVVQRVVTPTQVSLAADGSFTNSLNMKFVPVPGTDVLFCIHETRFQDFAAYAAEVPRARGAWNDNGSTDFDVPLSERLNHPANRVDWTEAQAFCKWLSKKEGKTYRLPTDREWSYAVGVGDDEKWTPDTTPDSAVKSATAYPWGDAWPPPAGVGNYCDETWKRTHAINSEPWIKDYDDGFALTAPVMSFKPNKLGLYDMGGNVAEWVEDWKTQEHKERVLRGGFWSSYPSEDFRQTLRSSTRIVRTYTSPLKNPSYGFRCVLEKWLPGAQPAHMTQVAAVAPAKLLPLGKFPNKMTEAEIYKSVETNSLGMKFVPVPGTDVKFCIHETRYKDYAVYAAEAPGLDPMWKNQVIDGFPVQGNGEDHPVIKVSQEDARAFCLWLGKKEGKTYRLPKDREWSFAVGIGEYETWTVNTTPRTVFKPVEFYPWESPMPVPSQAGNYSDQYRRNHAPHEKASYLENYDDGFSYTAPVMSFKPNKLGLYDMGGNVWEWCDDPFDTEAKDGVLRGASWTVSGNEWTRSSFRYSRPVTSRDPSFGFRAVLVP
jgi:formylglycine-generating enzyme required for sulfatase activity/serine/threonine protein kinase